MRWCIHSWRAAVDRRQEVGRIRSNNSFCCRISLLSARTRVMNGSTDMANKRVIPITAGTQRSKRGRVVVQANNGTLGIEIRAQLPRDEAALSAPDSSPGTEPSGVTEEISFRGCDEIYNDKKTYSIGSDCGTQVLAAGQVKPGEALTFSTLEELTQVRHGLAE